MSEEPKRIKFKKYIDQINNPSDDFNRFLYDYFIGSPMIRGRLEEDNTVWDRLQDRELAVAKQMVLDNLGHDSAYIRAIGIFRDERGIPLLENLIKTISDRYTYEKLLAAKILYDWIGYKPYLKLLKKLLKKGGTYTKTDILYWINGIEEDIAIHYIFLMLRDKDSFVRWCAYEAFKKYFNLDDDRFTLDENEQKKRYDENKYYTDDSIYANKELFKKRLKELKIKIENLRVKADKI